MRVSHLRSIPLLALLALLIVGVVPSASAEKVTVDTVTERTLFILIDGIEMEFDPAPYIVPSGRTMVPLRALFEVLGASVEWDDVSRSVTAKRAERSITLTIGSPVAFVDGQQYLLDAVPEIRHGRTFVPLRFVAEALHSQVGYNAELRQVSVRSVDPRPADLEITPGTNLVFRVQLVNMVLLDRIRFLVNSAGDFPSAITYTISGTLYGESVPFLQRELRHLASSRVFMARMMQLDETDTAPWISAEVYYQLKESGSAQGFIVGGLGQNGQQITALTVVSESDLVFNQNEQRVIARVLEAVTPAGDRLWIHDSPKNPLVLKFQPVGQPFLNAIGTLGYQIESVQQTR